MVGCLPCHIIGSREHLGEMEDMEELCNLTRADWVRAKTSRRTGRRGVGGGGVWTGVGTAL